MSFALLPSGMLQGVRVVESDDEGGVEGEWDEYLIAARELKVQARLAMEERVSDLMAEHPVFEGERGFVQMELPSSEGLCRRDVYCRQVSYQSDLRVMVAGGVPVLNGLEYWMDREEESVRERGERNLAEARSGEATGGSEAFARRMDALLSKPEEPDLRLEGLLLGDWADETETPQMVSSFDVPAGGATFIGKRPQMEDVIRVWDRLDGGLGYSVLCDGHGGSRDCALAVSRHHSRFLTERLVEMEEYGIPGRLYALQVASVDLTRSYPGHAGTTLCSVVEFPDGMLACSNLGDSRAFLIAEQGGVVQLSEDQRVIQGFRAVDGEGIEEVLSRYAVESIRHGHEIIRGRIEGVLKTARAIGNECLTSGRSVVTSIDRAGLELQLGRSLGEGERVFVVLVSDGVTDVASTEQIGRLVVGQFAKGHSLARVAADVVWTAYKARSLDNLSCVVRLTRLGY